VDLVLFSEKCFPSGNESVNPPVQISFIDPTTEKLFCTRALLESRFDPPLPTRIMTRMAVLKAAPTLAAVPTRPPINLRKQGSEFLISVAPDLVLRIRPNPRPESDLANVRGVIVLGLSTLTH
jgi:hypothetical protein